MYRRHILCTLYGAVDSLIVPSKGLYGCGGSFMHLSGPSREIKFLYASAPLPPTVRALWAEFDAISHDPKNSRFPGPNHLSLAQVMDAAHIKSIMQGSI